MSSTKTNADSSSDKTEKRFLQAAKDRNAQKLQECLDYGVHVNCTEKSSGNSALHYLLADGCFCNNCVSKLEACMEKLLHSGADPNKPNGSNKVPLEFAVDHLVPFGLVKMIMDHGATIVSERGITNRQLMKKLIRKMPEVICEDLNKGVRFTDESVDDNGLKTVQLDWRHIVYSPDGDSRNIKWKETEFLYDVVAKANHDGKIMILTHPLVQAFLNLKFPKYWKPFGYFYCIWTTLTFIMYLTFIWTVYNNICTYKDNSTTSAISDEDNSINAGCKMNLFVNIISYVILILYFVGPVGLEIRKFLTMGLKAWIRQWQNYVFIPASILVGVTLYPALTFKDDYDLTWQYPSAAIGMLVGSLSIMLQMTPVPFVALYLEMLFKILLRIVIASIALSPLYLGFFFSFRILITKEHIGWFQLFTMIVSDSDYEEMMDDGRGDYYEIVAYLFFSTFIILVIIVVVNFLIGLAVSDVEQLQTSARVTDLGNRVKSYYILDGVYQAGSNKFITTKGLIYAFQPLKEKTNYKLGSSLKIDLLKLARECCCHPHNNSFASQVSQIGLAAGASEKSVKVVMGD